MTGNSIRQARMEDAGAIQAIYAFHVENGTASFDTEAPDEAFWRDKIAQVLKRGWPFIVAHISGNVVGYAYAAQFRDRPAYAPTCENSVYVANSDRGRGIGRDLLSGLMAAAQESAFEQMVAVIGGGEPASVALHESLGFVHAGRLTDVGFKFGRKLDTIYMQLNLAPRKPPL